MDITLDDTQPVLGDVTITNPECLQYGRHPDERQHRLYDAAARTINSIQDIAAQTRDELRRLRPSQDFAESVSTAFLEEALRLVQEHDSPDATLTVYPLFIVDPRLRAAFVHEDIDPRALRTASTSGASARISLPQGLAEAARPDGRTLRYYAWPGTPVDRQLADHPLGHVRVSHGDKKSRDALRFAYDSMLIDAIGAYAFLTGVARSPSGA